MECWGVGVLGCWIVGISCKIDSLIKNMHPRIIVVRPLENYKLEVTFSDGAKGVLDWSERLKRAKPGGVFEPLKKPEYFAQIEIWEGTIRWPTGADICLDALYEQIELKPICE